MVQLLTLSQLLSLYICLAYIAIPYQTVIWWLGATIVLSLLTHLFNREIYVCHGSVLNTVGQPKISSPQSSQGAPENESDWTQHSRYYVAQYNGQLYRTIALKQFIKMFSLSRSKYQTVLKSVKDDFQVFQLHWEQFLSCHKGSNKKRSYCKNL